MERWMICDLHPFQQYVSHISLREGDSDRLNATLFMNEKIPPPTGNKLAGQALTLKAPITTAADDIHKYFFYCSSRKIRLDICCESSARQRIT